MVRPSNSASAGGQPTRRSVLSRVGAVAGVPVITSLAGCTLFGGDHASYWSESTQLEIEYDEVVTAAETAGYDVDGPFYVGTKDARGPHPEGLSELDARFGPDYRVFGFGLHHTDLVFLEVWLTGDSPTVSLFDDRAMGDFPVESLPPESWLVDQFSLAFALADADARSYAADLKEQAAEGTDIPSVEVDGEADFIAVYDSIGDSRTSSIGTETGGDGWYKETSYGEDRTIATVDFIVQSVEIRRREGNHVYTLKLDRLGGLYLQIRLPVGEEIPEEEYRGVFRRLFEDVGLPAEVVDELTFEYEPSIW